MLSSPVTLTVRAFPSSVFLSCFLSWQLDLSCYCCMTDRTAVSRGRHRRDVFNRLIVLSAFKSSDRWPMVKVNSSKLIGHPQDTWCGLISDTADRKCRSLQTRPPPLQVVGKGKGMLPFPQAGGKHMEPCSRTTVNTKWGQGAILQPTNMHPHQHASWLFILLFSSTAYLVFSHLVKLTACIL